MSSYADEVFSYLDVYFLQDDLKAKAKIEEIAEGKENDTSEAKPGV